MINKHLQLKLSQRGQLLAQACLLSLHKHLDFVLSSDLFHILYSDYPVNPPPPSFPLPQLSLVRNRTKSSKVTEVSWLSLMSVKRTHTHTNTHFMYFYVCEDFRRRASPSPQPKTSTQTQFSPNCPHITKTSSLFQQNANLGLCIQPGKWVTLSGLVLRVNVLGCVYLFRSGVRVTGWEGCVTSMCVLTVVAVPVPVCAQLIIAHHANQN